MSINQTNNDLFNKFIKINLLILINIIFFLFARHYCFTTAYIQQVMIDSLKLGQTFNKLLYMNEI